MRGFQNYENTYKPTEFLINLDAASFQPMKIEVCSDTHLFLLKWGYSSALNIFQRIYKLQSRRYQNKRIEIRERRQVDSESCEILHILSKWRTRRAPNARPPSSGTPTWSYWSTFAATTSARAASIFSSSGVNCCRFAIWIHLTFSIRDSGKYI